MPFNIPFLLNFVYSTFLPFRSSNAISPLFLLTSMYQSFRLFNAMSILFLLTSMCQPIQFYNSMFPLFLLTSICQPFRFANAMSALFRLASIWQSPIILIPYTFKTQTDNAFQKFIFWIIYGSPWSPNIINRGVRHCLLNNDVG